MKQVEDPDANTVPPWLAPLIAVLVIAHLVAVVSVTWATYIIWEPAQPLSCLNCSTEQQGHLSL